MIRNVTHILAESHNSLVMPANTDAYVIPAKAGIHDFCFSHTDISLDSRFHGNDGKEVHS